MDRTIVAALISAFALSGSAGTADPPTVATLAEVAWLAGSCWTGAFAGGATKDLVCYDWMLGAAFLRSRHRIIEGTAPYSGETIIGRNPASGRLEYTYFSSNGGVMRGEIVPTDDGLEFPPGTMEMGGATYEVRSAWKRSGADRYVASSERLVDGALRPFMAVEFVRSGPSSEWREKD